ncbi:Gmad2 immunoglobulin-like domain-containing protein [Microcella sp.]|uniref:Gmad2 immunoglobulin-like domain-containing protein n=1 Tax=Microcella sp. TaxID=1913979 RepID=UPI00256E6221|nr:Gmad2 immunoglobulin-like domain-containing protein [Microcella sp.]MBX9471380.1 GerMN domain-containing protein [Microcella sp.]
MRASALRVISIAAIVALGGCVGPQPGISPEPSPPASSPAVQEIGADVYFSHSQPSEFTLISEPHTVLVAEGASVLDTVLGALIGGELQPTDPEYANLWGNGSALLSTQSGGDVLTIDLTVGALNVGAEAESIAIAQLVWTAVGIDPAIGAVQLTIDGAVSETLAGHVDISGPISPEPPEGVLTPVQILVPTEGASVMTPVVAVGVACVFEAAFLWRLEGPGASLVEGSAMAAEACPTRADWQLDLGDLAPGDYVLTVLELSPRDGSVSSTDSKAFTVVG